MLNAVQEKPHRSTQVMAKSVGEGRSSNPPPVMAVPVNPHPVFGPIGKEGLDLEQQSIHVLDFWHKKATALCTSVSDSDFEAVHKVQWDLYRAATRAKIGRAREVAVKLALMVRHLSYNDGDDCGFMTLAELTHVTAQLEQITAPIVPSKAVGRPNRGLKLTRAGLLQRYQSFLVQELETVSWNLYGERDFAKFTIGFDDAVSEKCRGKSKYTLFDESKLTGRAKAVLGALKISTTQVGRASPAASKGAR